MGIEILPCCVDCKTGYVPFKNDIVVHETIDEIGKPYKLWSADLLECPKCHHRIISGFGRSPIAEHYQPGFAQTLTNYLKAGIVFFISGQRLAMRDWDRRTN